MKTRIAMKTLLAILYLCIALTGCTSNEKKNHTTSIHQEETTSEIQEKEFPKAACILWIDKNKEKTLKGKLIRNVKARVHIGELGKITVLEYEKKLTLYSRTKSTIASKPIG